MEAMRAGGRVETDAGQPAPASIGRALRSPGASPESIEGQTAMRPAHMITIIFRRFSRSEMGPAMRPKAAEVTGWMDAID